MEGGEEYIETQEWVDSGFPSPMPSRAASAANMSRSETGMHGVPSTPKPLSRANTPAKLRRMDTFTVPVGGFSEPNFLEEEPPAEDGENKKQKVEEKWGPRIPEGPMKELKGILSSCLGDVQMVLVCHRQSLTVQHAALLLMRLLFREPFMRQAEIERFVTAGTGATVEDDSEDDDEDDAGGGGQEEEMDKEMQDDDVMTLSSRETIALKMKKLYKGGKGESKPKHKKHRKPAAILSEWHRLASEEEVEKARYAIPPKLNFFEVLKFSGEAHVQSPEVMEQFLLLVYQLASSSHISKVTMVDFEVDTTVRHYLDLANNTYLVALTELCVENLLVE